MDYEGDREEEGAHIGDRLCRLNAYAVECVGKEKYRREEKYTLSAACKEGCDSSESETLIELIDESAERHKGDADAEEVKGFCSDRDNFRVIAEEPHYLLGEYRGKRPKDKADNGADLDCEGEAFPGALFVARSVVVARGGLKSLTETDDNVSDEHIHLVGYRDSRAGGFKAVFDGLNVKRGGGNACKTLTEYSGYACGDNGFVVCKTAADALEVDLYDRLACKEYDEQDREADGLTDHRCNCRTSRAHIASVDKDRVEDHIEYAARGDSDHRKEREPFTSQCRIQYEGRAVERRGDENESRVRNGVREHQIGASEKDKDRFKEGESDNGDDCADQDRCRECA